jgi:cell division protein FtsL
MAAAQSLAPIMRRSPSWTGTPEIYFAKPIDNSRLVKVENPQKSREMKHFGAALACLFLLVMTFAWQHFRAIEYGYKIETLRMRRDSLAEMNRALRLEEASLRDPERIDTLARKLGLQSPQAGQVMYMETALPDAATPVLASARLTPLVSAR